MNQSTSTIVVLNNDAASCIRSKQYYRATILLDEALVELVKSSSCPHFSASMETKSSSKLSRKRSRKHLCKPDEGIDTFVEPVDLSDVHSSDEHIARLFICYNLGIAHSRLGHDEDALCYFLKAKTQNKVVKSLNTFCRSSQQLHQEAMLALLHNLGRLYFRCDRRDDAMGCYETALQLAQRHCGKHHLHTALTLNCIGLIHLASNPNEEETEFIMNLFLEALEILETLSPNDESSERVNLSFQATVFNNLGRLKLLRDEHAAAKKMFQTSYFIRQKLYGDIHCDVAAVLFNAGEAEYGIGNLDEAIRLYLKFVNTSLVNPDTENRQDVAIAFKRLGRLHHEKNEHTQAIDMYVQALKAYKLVLGEVNLEITSILNEIGAICYECNDHTKALTFYQEAGRLLRQIDSSHPELASTFINTARIYQQQREDDQALEQYQEALKIMRMCPKTEEMQLEIACVLSSIGLINDHRGRYFEATDAFEAALEIRMEVQGGNHFDVSCTLNAIGLIYFKQGLLDLAVCNFKDSLDIRLKQEVLNSADISVVLFNIAAVYFELGETDMAIYYYEQTLQHEYDSCNENKTDKLATLKRLAQIHLSQGDLDEALFYYHEAVTVLLENLNNCPNTEVAFLLSSIGNIYLQTGEIEKAREAYVEALRINVSEGVDDISNIVTDGLIIHDVMKESCHCAAVA